MTAFPSPPPSPSFPCNIHALHAELAKAQDAGQIAKVALAHKDVRLAIDQAICGQWETLNAGELVRREFRRTRVQLKEFQHDLQSLKQQLAALALKNHPLDHKNEGPADLALGHAQSSPPIHEHPPTIESSPSTPSPPSTSSPPMLSNSPPSPPARAPDEQVRTLLPQDSPFMPSPLYIAPQEATVYSRGAYSYGLIGP